MFTFRMMTHVLRCVAGSHRASSAPYLTAIQCTQYFIFGVLIGSSHVIFGSSLSLTYFFEYEAVGFDNGPAVVNSMCWLLTAIVGSVSLCIVVERARKCLDFTSTFYILHLLLSTWYNGSFPASWEWWTIVVFNATVMTTIGEQLCMRVEMQDIKFDNVFDGFLEPTATPAGKSNTSIEMNQVGFGRPASKLRKLDVSANNSTNVGLSPPNRMPKRKTSDRGSERNRLRSSSLSPKRSTGKSPLEKGLRINISAMV